jgi:hypothetical protein
MASLIDKTGNKFIIQINRTNVVSITQENDKNYVKFFKEGKFVFEYTDIKINEIKFIRNLNNEKFTF